MTPRFLSATDVATDIDMSDPLEVEEEVRASNRGWRVRAKKNSEWFHDAPELRAYIAEHCSRRSLRLARMSAA